MTHFVTRFNDEYAFLDIVGEPDDDREFFVEFIDLDTNDVRYSDKLKINYWAQLDSIGSMNIQIKVTSNGEVVFERRRDKKFNRVYIKFGSNALGDNIAWIPYVEEYRKLNGVDVVLYTSHNYLFDKVYKDIIFTDILNPDIINDVDKKFKIDYGPELYRINEISASDHWHEQNKKFDNVVKYFDYRKQPLQSIAPLILGLSNKEIVPKVNIPDDGPNIKGKYVVVAIQSTSQLKYWNDPFGWERVFDFLGRNGYKIVIIDKYKNFGVHGSYNQAPKGKYVIDKTGNRPLTERIIDIKYADMMITVSSGLAWLSWAVGTQVVMISGFTKPWNEFQSNIIRVHNTNVCNGCWNDPDVTYDASKWLFCPKNKDFICSKAIQPKDVVDAIKKIMK